MQINPPKRSAPRATIHSTRLVLQDGANARPERAKAHSIGIPSGRCRRAQRQLICLSLDANQDSRQLESVASEQLESDCRKTSAKERRSCTTRRSITARFAGSTLRSIGCRLNVPLSISVAGRRRRARSPGTSQIRNHQRKATTGERGMLSPIARNGSNS